MTPKLSFILLLVAASCVLTSMTVQNSYAKFPEGSKARLHLEVQLWSEDRNTKNVNIWTEYKEQVIKHNINYKEHRSLYVIVPFDFKPEPRGFLDFYEVCAKNVKTGEVNCQYGYWFPGTDESYLRVKIPGFSED